MLLRKSEFTFWKYSIVSPMRDRVMLRRELTIHWGNLIFGLIMEIKDIFVLLLPVSLSTDCDEQAKERDEERSGEENAVSGCIVQ